MSPAMCRWSAFERCARVRPKLEFLGEVGHRPQQLGEGLVLEQVLVRKQGEQERLLLGSTSFSARRSQSHASTVQSYSLMRLLGVGVVGLADQPCLMSTRSRTASKPEVVGRDHSHQLRAYLAVEGADDHVELLEHRFALALS